jgi:hypothetical protein
LATKCMAWQNRTGQSAQMMCGHCVFRDLLPNFIPCDFVLEAPFWNLSSDFQGRIEPPRPSCDAQPSLLNVFSKLMCKVQQDGTWWPKVWQKWSTFGRLDLVLCQKVKEFLYFWHFRGRFLDAIRAIIPAIGKR